MHAQDTDYQPEGRPFTGRKFLLIILAFFGVIIAANMTMLSYALSSFGGLVVKNSYVASQTFNADVAEQTAHPMSGWQVALTPVADGMRIALSDAQGAPVSGVALSAVIGRPTHEREDQRLVFVETPTDGTYFAPATIPQGALRALLRMEQGTLHQNRSATLFVKQDQAN
ncbi:MAG: FixH family protein [Neomegalonema sp.]|nr:FixH family protein [Neomegalonema sp.]